RITFKGFLALYEEKEDEQKQQTEQPLPPIQPGERLSPLDIENKQGFTKPPGRYTEASLVKALEHSGIGRPSTYAAIMNKIQGRSYTEKERLQLRPTQLGRIIAQMLENHFHMVMNIAFTAKMEEELDAISEGKEKWKAALKRFLADFLPMIEKAEKEATVPKITTEIPCPKCGNMLQKIWAKNNYFYGCSSYPDCPYSSSIEEFEFNKEDYADDFDWEQKCAKCGEEMLLRFGRFGPFLGCSQYPNCRRIVSIPKKGESSQAKGPNCPASGCEGTIQERKSRWGKSFLSCSEYPDCDVIGNTMEIITKKFEGRPKQAHQKTATSKGKILLPPALQAITGEKQLSRPALTKALWEYIKKNQRQDPKDRRQIIPDDTLSAIFGQKEPFHMFQLAGKLSEYLKNNS
ncbi:MAG: DNA topoisomerase, partial [Chlamydiota bacterium]|nr:DNA topoisomerase [Chlamydiota bacterium]